MTQRIEGGVTWTQTFNAENRLASVSNGTDTWTFVYDGDGNRVKQVNPDGKILLFLGGGSYTVVDAAGSAEVTKYYSVGGQRIAMRKDGELSYLLTDHLGSVDVVLEQNEQGNWVSASEQRYLPFGGKRHVGDGISETDFGYTGQRDLAATGLMDYNARWYSPAISNFSQPDSTIPNFANPQDLNRYSYVSNNPVNFSDPSGHWACIDDQVCGNPGIVSPPPGSGSGGGGGGEGNKSSKKDEKKFYCDLRPENCEDREQWEIDALRKLYDAGKMSSMIVDAIFYNNIRIKTGSCESFFTNADACWDIPGMITRVDMTVIVEGDQDSLPADKQRLALIAHESWHLMQGLSVAASKYGELEAWKVQMVVLQELRAPVTDPTWLAIQDLPLSHDLTVLFRAADLMTQAVPGYGIYFLPPILPSGR
jgi:RHS repeat-associated protein